MEIRYPDSVDNNSVENGCKFEDFIKLALYQRGIILQVFKSKYYQFKIGESYQGIEVKYDSWCSKSKRLSIEIAEKTAIQKNWINSGILRKDNSWLYIQGNEEIAFIFMKKILIGLYKSKKYKEKEEKTIKTFYLPFEDALKYGERIYPGNEEANYWADIGWNSIKKE